MKPNESLKFFEDGKKCGPKRYFGIIRMNKICKFEGIYY